MTHYFVLVLTRKSDDYTPEDTAKKLLAPFDEGLDIDFVDTEDKMRKDYAEGTSTMIVIDGVRKCAFDRMFRTSDDPFISTADRYRYPEGSTKLQVPHKERFQTFDSYACDWEGVERDPQTGKYGYWHNPLGRWDYFVIGGRWDQALLGNSSRHRDADNTNLCNSGPDSTKREGNVRPLKDIPVDDFSCHAILTPEGEWIEKGTMGMFGVCKTLEVADETWAAKVREILTAERYADCVAVAVDCHC